MKTYLTILLVLFLTLSHAQPTLPKFKQAQPIWSHLLYNPYIIDNQHGELNKAYNFAYTRLITKDSFEYASTLTINEDLLPNGYILSKINYRTGQIMWSDQTHPSTEKAGHLVEPSNIYFRPENKVELLGNRKVEPRFINNFDMSYRRVYDDRTGIVLSTQYDTSNLAKYNRSGNSTGDYVTLKYDSLYLQMNTGIYGFNTTQVLYLFNIVSADQSQVREIARLAYEPNQPTNGFSYRSAEAKVLNDSIYVGLVKVRTTDFSKYPNKMELVYINYKDTSNIHIVRTIDITDKAIYDDRYGFSQHLYIENDNVLILNSYYDWDKRRQFSYLLTLDEKGEVLNYIKALEIERVNHLAYYPLRVTDTLSYFLTYLSRYADKTQYSYDIISLDQNNEGKYVASFYTTEDTPEESFRALSYTLTDDNYLLMNGQYIKKLAADTFADSNWLLGFKLEDLIKGSIVSTDEITHSDPSTHLGAYPNPASDRLFIDFPMKLLGTEMTVTLHDLLGRQVFSTVMTNSINDNYITIADLPAGTYLLHCTLNSSNTRLAPIKVVKL